MKYIEMELKELVEEADKQIVELQQENVNTTEKDVTWESILMRAHRLPECISAHIHSPRIFVCPPRATAWQMLVSVNTLK